MKNFCLVLATIVSLVLQTELSIFGVVPALTVIVAFYVGTTAGTTKGIFFGSLIGIIEDCVAGGMIGPNLLGKGIVGFLSSFLSGGIFRWTPVLGILSILILTIMDGFIVFLSKAIYETLPAPPSRAVVTILAQGILNAFAGMLIKPKGAD